MFHFYFSAGTMTTSKDSPKKKAIVNGKGYSWLMAVVFMLGDMVGGGLIVLPTALVNMGLIPGLLILCCFAILTPYTAYQLSECWVILQKRWPEYRNHCRKPYSDIAFRAGGEKMRTFLSTILCINQFGFATILLLLAAKNVSLLLSFFLSIRISFCYLIVIVAIGVWPATMLKSPMDFWQAAVFSAASSSTAVVLIVFGTIHDASECLPNVGYSPFDSDKFFMGFGTVVFALGGHAAFPTIQHDMKKPAHFKRTIITSFAVMVIYYSIVAISGYSVYGNSLGDTVIPSIQLSWVQQTVNTLIAIHVITTIVIVFSPLTQLLEDVAKTPQSFGWQRFFVRSALFWTIVFVALSLPNFGPLMDLMGASTMILTSMILPPLFYISLKASLKKREERIRKGEVSADSSDEEGITFREMISYSKTSLLIVSAICIVFGLVGGFFATISSFTTLLSIKVATPCYVQYFRGALSFSDSNAGSVNCCGAYHNITVSGISPDGFCRHASF